MCKNVGFKRTKNFLVGKTERKITFEYPKRQKTCTRGYPSWTRGGYLRGPPWVYPGEDPYLRKMTALSQIGVEKYLANGLEKFLGGEPLANSTPIGLNMPRTTPGVSFPREGGGPGDTPLSREELKKKLSPLSGIQFILYWWMGKGNKNPSQSSGYGQLWLHPLPAHPIPQPVSPACLFKKNRNKHINGQKAPSARKFWD